MCDMAPTGDVGGMVTMLLIPAKVPAPTLGPWQVEQPLTIPVWSICPPAKLLKPFSVEAIWQVAH